MNNQTPGVRHGEARVSITTVVKIVKVKRGKVVLDWGEGERTLRSGDTLELASNANMTVSA